jgi:phospholipase A1
VLLGFLCSLSIAYASTNPVANTNNDQQQQKQNGRSFFFPIMPYEANYILPFYYVSKPYYAIYRGNTPDDQPVQHHEVKFQFSLAMLFWKNIFGYPLNLYGAYTQLSFWQAYAGSAWFRETNYTPRVFLSYKASRPLIGALRLESINIGGVHQSNGRGGNLERSWNRFYFDVVFSFHRLSFMITPWLVEHDKYYRIPSVNITRHTIKYYLGNGKFTAVYRIHGNTFAVQTHNTMSKVFKPLSGQFTWSFPLPHVRNIKGYIQYFTGYGQSLIELDHRTNAIGIGLAYNDIDLENQCF